MTKKNSPEKNLEIKLEKAILPKICRCCKQLTPYEKLTTRGTKCYKGTDIKQTITLCKTCFNKKSEQRKIKNQSESYIEKRKRIIKRQNEKNKSEEKKLKIRNRGLIRTYGIDNNWVDMKLLEQDLKCLICKQELCEKTKRVDHCHSTGKIRGLLCNLCNVGLGAFKDNIESLQNAIVYLKKFNN